jgi:hypothetical protein
MVETGTGESTSRGEMKSVGVHTEIAGIYARSSQIWCKKLIGFDHEIVKIEHCCV